MLIATSMNQDQVDRFEKLPAEEREKQIRIAMLAKLRPIGEWMTASEIYDERVRLASNQGNGCGQCIDGWVEITPGSPKIPCGFCDRA